MTTTPTRV